MARDLDRLTSLAPGQRRWHDLRRRRLGLGLAIAPILPVACGGLLIRFLDPFSDALDVAIFCGVVLGVAMAWSLLIGSLYVVLIPRRTGVIGRAGCLLLGIGLAVSLPPAAALSISGADALFHNATMMFGVLPRDLYGLAVTLALALIPFGALGGWVFWRVGVRPASPGASDLAGVFE